MMRNEKKNSKLNYLKRDCKKYKNYDKINSTDPVGFEVLGRKE